MQMVLLTNTLLPATRQPPSLRSMAVLSSRAHERRSREKIKIAPAPISWQFFCPRPPLSLSNQNRHATQASSRLTSLTVAEDASRNHIPQPRFQSIISNQTDGKIPRFQGFYSPCRGLFLESPGVSVLGIPITKSLAFWASPSHNYCNVLGIPWYPPGMPKSLVFSPLQKNSGFRRKIENVLEMDSAKCRNLFQHLKKKVYPEGFTKICQKVRV